MLKFCFFYLFAITVSIYLWMSFVGIAPFGLFVSILAPLIFGLVLYKKNYPFTLKIPSISLENIGLGAVVALQLATMAIVLSPLILTQRINGITFYEFTGINDFYKHVYALTAILQSGLPAIHPYYPPATFSYYYGYYVIPAALAQITHLPYNVVMWLYPLLTTGFSLVFLTSIAKRYITAKYLRILVLVILVVGTGLDIIPTRKINSPNIRHIESWSQELDLGLIVNNTFMSYIWVPQHVLAAIAVIYLAHLLYTQKQYSLTDYVVISTGLVFIALTSFFVAITAGLWLGTIFLLKSSSRKPLVIGGLVASILSIPYLLGLSSRGNLFTKYIPGFYTFITAPEFINRLLNLIIEYGPISFIAIIGLIFIAKTWKKRLAVFTMVVVPVVISWFIRTPGPNDFGMRSILPLQLLVPLVAVFAIEKISSIKVRGLLIIVMMANVVCSSLGYGFEHVYSWKDRRRLNVTESELITWVRSQPNTTRIASYQKEDWGFYIPSIGFKTNLSPHLYDSGVYVTGKNGPDHSEFEILGKEIFSNTTVGNTPKEVIQSREDSWQKLPRYLSWAPYDYFVVSQKEWVRKGINPWFEIFTAMNVKPTLIGKSFAAFPSGDLEESVAVNRIKVDTASEQLLVPKNEFVTLPVGLWYIVGCNTKGKVMVDFEQYFSLIETRLPSGCAGNLFVSADDEPIKISWTYAAEKLFAYKIIITTQ